MAAEADHRRWHLRGARALAVVLEQGYADGLPVLHWSVNMLGDLVADVHGLTITVDQQRAAFDAWCTYLDASRWPERSDADGTAHLHAVFTWRNDDRVKGAVRAVILPDSSDHA
jgi:hypothetical protein